MSRAARARSRDNVVNYDGIVIVTVGTMFEGNLSVLIFPMTVTSKQVWDWLATNPVVVRIVSLRGEMLRNKYSYVTMAMNQVEAALHYTDRDHVEIQETMRNHVGRFSLVDFQEQIENALARQPGDEVHPLGSAMSISRMLDNVSNTLATLGITADLPRNPLYNDSANSARITQMHELSPKFDRKPISLQEAKEAWTDSRHATKHPQKIFHVVDKEEGGSGGRSTRKPEGWLHRLEDEGEHLFHEAEHEGKHLLHEVEDEGGHLFHEAEHEGEHLAHEAEEEGSSLFHRAKKEGRHLYREAKQDAEDGERWVRREGSRLVRDAETEFDRATGWPDPRRS